MPIAECVSCALVRATPRCSPARIAERYSAEYFWNEYLPSVGVVNGVVDDNFIDGRYAPWIALVEKHVERGRLLEIGTGAGLFSKAFSRAGWSTVGVEINAEGAQFARDRLGLDVRQQYAEDLDLPEGSQDVVALMDVIEHVPNPVATVATARRLLRPGGVLLIQTPNLNAFSRTMLGAPWAVLSPAEHLYYFTERTLDALVKKAGFESTTFEWHFEGFGPAETMNARYTHAPNAVRAKAYAALVKFGGPRVFNWVRDTHRNDQLIAIARA